MKFKLINILFLLTIFLYNTVEGGCGNCQVDRNSESRKNVEKVQVNSLVTSVPENGAIEGLVIASCGKCNFNLKEDRRCNLTINIGDDYYPVKGTNIHKHGNAHGKEGFCSVVRVASTEGKIKEGIYYTDSFKLIGN